MLILSQGKAKNVVIKMLSAAGTGFFYTTTKNPRNVTRKLSLRKVLPLITRRREEDFRFIDLLVGVFRRSTTRLSDST
ncbi:hypothetical protein AM588_10006511 [Phytophthora nicotianae]|uniref:Uncharacterized protein n=1 Tax=Phytophthora nicotianae TaxID=4792 RepID=A0A0W8D8E8_PHYNI|nr:hypothetical protein AM588_10006511 [Phytophthora nicotianae]